MKYAWKDGSRLSGDAQVVGEAIASLAHQTLEAVVQAARNPKSPLHPYIYAVSDREAVRQYRLSRAGHVVRSVVLIERKGAPNPPRAFQFVFVSQRVNQGDEPTELHIIVTDGEARRNPTYRQQIIARLLAELTTAERELKRFRSSLAKPVGQLRKRVQREVEKSAA